MDPRVKAVRLRLAGGRTMDVPTHAGDGYTGRYAGRLRWFSATAPARPLLVELLDEAGQALTQAGFQEPRLAAPAKRLLRVRGGASVVAGTLERAFEGTGGTCVALVRGAPPRAGAECDGEVVLEAAVGEVDCTLRAAVIVVGVSARARRVAVRLGDGSRRVVPVRRVSDRERVAVVVPPARLAVRGITVRGAGGRAIERLPARVPPAARQCGYGLFVLPPGVA